MLIRVVGVEPPCDDLPHDRKRLLWGSGLDGLEIEAVERALADQALGFGGALRRDLGFWSLDDEDTFRYVTFDTTPGGLV